jgi:branched-chain amino acid transport system substrate-binding protein
VTGPITAAARLSLAAWVKAVNATGGIACHPVVLFAADDGSDPARAASLVQELVEQKHIQALAAVSSPLSLQGILGGIAKAKIPVIGGDGGAPDWNTNPLLFPTGAALIGDIRGALHQVISTGSKDLGLMYCIESSQCTTLAKAVTPEATKLGGSIAYSSAVSLAQPDFTAQCQNAKNAGVKAIFMAMDGGSIVRVARSCGLIGYHPQFVTSGLVVSPQDTQNPELRRDNLVTANSVAPWMLNDTPGQRGFHAALAAYAPKLVPDAQSIQAWAAGKLLEAAVRNAAADPQRPVTTADILAGLGKVRAETLDGLIPPITFKPGQSGAPLIDCTYYALLTDTGWTAPDGSRPTCLKG